MVEYPCESLCVQSITIMTKADTLAIIFPGQGMISHSQLLEGFWQTATTLGYRTLALHGMFEAIYNQLHLERIAGFAILYNLIGNEWLFQLEDSLPLLIISPDQSYPGISTVSVDNIGGSRSIVEHLIDHGHKQIAFIGCLAYPEIAQRYMGYELALRQADLPIEPELVVNIPANALQHPDIVCMMTEQLLGLGSCVSAIYAATDEIAIGVYKALQNANISIPSSMAVVGFNDSQTALTMVPPLTTVRQPTFDLGKVVARQLTEIIQDGEHSVQDAAVMGYVIERRSCGCPPSFLRGSIVPQLNVQIRDAELHIIQLAEVFTRYTTLSTTDGLLYARRLYHGFRSSLYAETNDAWVNVLEQELPAVVAQIELRQNLALVLHTLRYMAPAMRWAFDNPQLIEQRAEELMIIAERATAMYGIIHQQEQFNEWLSIGASFQNVTNHMVGFHNSTNPFPVLNRESLLSLSWLGSSTLEQAALFLRNKDTFEMYCERIFQRSGDLLQLAQDRPMAIPPAELIPDPISSLMMLYSMISDQDALGMMYFVLKEGETVLSYTFYSIWIAQFTALLQRINLEADLKDNNRTISTLYQQERTLVGMVRELAVPVVPIIEGIVALPLVGTIDEQRAQQIMANLLGSVNEYKAEIVIVDITGVPLVDTQTASYLLQAAQAVQLLGAQAIFVGIRPEIAQTIVHLGIDTKQLITAANMEAGLRQALGMRGLQVTSVR